MNMAGMLLSKQAHAKSATLSLDALNNEVFSEPCTSPQPIKLVLFDSFSLLMYTERNRDRYPE